MSRPDQNHLSLNRFAFCPWGTYGQLFCEGQTGHLWTVELPWLHNRRFVSCIPCGWYALESFEHPRLGFVLRVNDVPGRYGILFHRGNVPSDLSGCIAVGRWSQYSIGGKWGVGHSVEAFRILESQDEIVPITSVTIYCNDVNCAHTPDRATDQLDLQT